MIIINLTLFCGDPRCIDTNATGTVAIKTLKTLLRDFAQERAQFAREQADNETMADTMNEIMASMRKGFHPRW